MPKSRRAVHVSKRPKHLTRKDADARGLPDGRALTPAQIAELNLHAREFTWALFGVCQLAGMINVDEKAISAVAAHAQSPFSAATKKARPEDVSRFLLVPPKGFELPKRTEK